VGGTDDYSTRTGRQPFDLTSDFAALAHQSPGSERAVVAAMKDAGVTRTSPVVFNGYSQGGLVAASLAASGHYHVKGVVTFGAPASGYTVPAHVPMLVLQHSDDLVPSLGGWEKSPQAVVVSRQVFGVPPHGTAAHPLPAVLPAHLLSHYRETASLVDGSIDDSLRIASEPFDDFARHASTVTTTTWLATRVEPSR
jgi:pimeloyl-ACP methyl ester carboxylesterase